MRPVAFSNIQLVRFSLDHPNSQIQTGLADDTKRDPITKRWIMGPRYLGRWTTDCVGIILRQVQESIKVNGKWENDKSTVIQYEKPSIFHRRGRRLECVEIASRDGTWITAGQAVFERPLNLWV